MTHTASDMAHTACDTTHTACDMTPAACDMTSTACDMIHTACDVTHAACFCLPHPASHLPGRLSAHHTHYTTCYCLLLPAGLPACPTRQPLP